MPVGYPAVYSIYLAKKQGTYATLGLAEDTWALNEGILNDDHFIRQCLDMDNEREAMFLDALDKVPRGLVACVFDGTDRLQHTFWRDIDPTHPARPDAALLANRNVIEDLYTRMDDLVGKTMEKCRDKGTLLMVISDHGFGPFRTGVDLNRWLVENGYLVLHDGRGGEEHLAGVDWSRTRAFAIGLAGIFINVKEKYDQGIVDPGAEADRLREEIARRLETLTHPETGESAVKRVYVAGKFYRGPYKDNAPDLIVGYQRGYRVSWEAAIGKTTEAVFHPNTKAWSGDHCVDPSLVPGILFCNHPIADREPALDRYRPHRAQHVRHRRSGLHGRQGALRWAPPRQKPSPRAKTPWPRPFDDDGSSPKLTRRTLLAGTAAVGRRGRRAGRRQLLARQPPRASRSAGKKVIVIGIDGMDPRLSERMMKAGLAAQPREAARRRRVQHAGHQHAAAEPRRLGQLHQRGRAGRPWDLRLHPPQPRRSSAPRSTRQRRPSRAKEAWRSARTRFSSISGRSITSCPGPCSSARACRSGITSTRRGCRRPSTTCPPTIRQARRTTATIAASAGWARRTCWGPTAPTSISPRTGRRKPPTKAAVAASGLG